MLCDKVVVIFMGFQGEFCVVLVCIVQDEYFDIVFFVGDWVIFFLCVILGNEKVVGLIINSFIDQGIEIIID